MRSGLVRLAIGCGVIVGLLVALTSVAPRERPVEHSALDSRAVALDYVASGKHLLTQQRLPEAFAAFTEAVRLAPDLPDAHRGLAAVAYDQGAVIEAVGHLERVANLDPTDGRPHRMIGHICADLDKREDAVAAYREALRRQLTPAAADEVGVELADQLLKLGDAEAALAALPDSLPVGDNGVRAAAIRAEATWTTTGAEEAVTMTEAALQQTPDDPRLLSLLGRLHVDLGNHDKAVDPLVQAADRDQTELTTLQALAIAYERVGRPQDAATTRQRRADVQAALERMTALNIDADAQPWNAAIREELATICESLGKVDLAAMWRHAAAQARVSPIPERGQ
jgi:Flp pilus assembly protein TadD